jgi:hypothetical protein
MAELGRDGASDEDVAPGPEPAANPGQLVLAGPGPQRPIAAAVPECRLATLQGRLAPVPVHPLAMDVIGIARVAAEAGAASLDNDVGRYGRRFFDPSSALDASTSLVALAERAGHQGKWVRKTERRLAAAAELCERARHQELQVVFAAS